MSAHKTTNSRDTILQAVRADLPRPAVDLPVVPADFRENSTNSGIGYRGDLTELEEVKDFSKPDESLAPSFQRHLKAMGGQSFLVNDLTAAQAKIRELFPDAKRFCSAIPELSEWRRITASDDTHSFQNVDVAIVRSRLGVAEAGTVWLTDADLFVPSLGVLTQHLVVLLDSNDIILTLHEAYGGKINLPDISYGVFMAGRQRQATSKEPYSWRSGSEKPHCASCGRDAFCSSVVTNA